jgi:hypothetical protein
VTVGLVHWSLDRKGLTSGFVPAKVHEKLDFVSVHIYPEAGKLDEALETLQGFNLGKPVVIEEIFPLKCSTAELETFLQSARGQHAGLMGFYWGKTREECKRSGTLRDAIMLSWLDYFFQNRPPVPNPGIEPAARP